ncbi:MULTISPECIES: hypothetical protein [unclassified Lysobacter]|uniref:hypothetical protein n=1 Tax=unclassified Lysobacter TaxID=2635362 RepID=UPI001BE92A3C|nr:MULTISPECIES: hypothetical protein [unclassified Lysobacter]MBT2748536.1 hypothetical protein [Lysobacter sp. ISL-42]MBT2752901.1 hypothetical protein [Lysobacter sp. ISL-50]MBT2775970.1 hypothetical protein [Lysobacter sp. ISL-54]MBT2783767.1 hypothetical protein [Lysobacter sp. ISL-52]
MVGDNSLGYVFLSVQGLCVLGALLLVWHRFRPLPRWAAALGIARWLIVAVGGLEAAWVVHLAISAADSWARLMAYAAALAFSPAIVSALVALIFRPRR